MSSTVGPEVGRNVVTLSRSEAKTLRVVINNPPAAGIAGWTFALVVYALSDLTTPVLSKVDGFTVTAAADTFEATFETIDYANLPPDVYEFKIVKADTDIRLAWGPLIVAA